MCQLCVQVQSGSMSAGVVAVAATGVTLSVKNSVRQIRSRVKGDEAEAKEPDELRPRIERDALR
jgi:hypothetical protein